MAYAGHDAPSTPECDLNAVQVSARATPTIAEVICAISSPPWSGGWERPNLHKNIPVVQER